MTENSRSNFYLNFDLGLGDASRKFKIFPHIMKGENFLKKSKVPVVTTVQSNAYLY